MNRNQDIEKLLSVMVQNKLLFQEICLRFEPNLFDEILYNNFVVQCREFFAQNKRPPSLEEFRLFAGKNYVEFNEFAPDVFTQVPQITVDYAKKELYQCYQKQSAKVCIENIINNAERGHFDIKEELTRWRDLAMKTSPQEEDDLDVSLSDLYLEARDYRSEGLAPLIFKDINKYYGGQAKGELLIYIAPPNRGKTLYLINELHNAILHDEHTLYLSMENVKKSIVARLTTRMLYMTKKEQRGNERRCVNFIKHFENYTQKPVIIYRPANAFTVDELGLWIDDYQYRTGKQFDRVIIDYMLKFKRKEKKTWSEADSDRKCADDLRALAIEKNLRVQTAAQTNRSGIVNKEGSLTETTDESMIQGGFGQFETADIVLSFSETPAEKQKGGGRVTILKFREEGGRGTQSVVTVAPWIQLLTDHVEQLIPEGQRDHLLENPDKERGRLPGLHVKRPVQKEEKSKDVASIPDSSSINIGKIEGVSI